MSNAINLTFDPGATDRSGGSSMRLKIDGTWHKDEHKIDAMRLDAAGRNKRCSYLMLTDGKLYLKYIYVMHHGDSNNNRRQFCKYNSKYSYYTST